MKPRRDKPKTASNSPTFALSAPTLVWDCLPYLATYQLIKLLEVSWFSVGGFLFFGRRFLVSGRRFLVFFVEGFLGEKGCHKPQNNGIEHEFLFVERRLSKLEKL